MERPNMRTITLEEHFATPAFIDGPLHGLKEQGRHSGERVARLIGELCDGAIDAGRFARLEAMLADEAGYVSYAAQHGRPPPV